MYKLQHTVTANTATQANAMLAQMQTQLSKYALSVEKYEDDLYAVVLARSFKSYNTAVKHFNSTVQLFCSIAAEHVDDEEHVPSCYVIDAEGGAVY